jgi:hypothetical protein
MRALLERTGPMGAAGWGSTTGTEGEMTDGEEGGVEAEAEEGITSVLLDGGRRREEEGEVDMPVEGERVVDGGQ